MDFEIFSQFFSAEPLYLYQINGGVALSGQRMVDAFLVVPCAKKTKHYCTIQIEQSSESSASNPETLCTCCDSVLAAGKSVE